MLAAYSPFNKDSLQTFASISFYGTHYCIMQACDISLVDAQLLHNFMIFF